jgi:adenosine deaminase
MEAMDSLFQLTHNIPKIELHAHIGGCFRPMTFLELAEAKKIDTDHIDFYNVDIKTAFEIFKVGSQLITDPQTLKRVTKEIIEDYNKQNCRYLELRSTPKQIGKIESKEMYIDCVIEAI